LTWQATTASFERRYRVAETRLLRRRPPPVSRAAANPAMLPGS
jgi:hypothetical protein